MAAGGITGGRPLVNEALGSCSMEHIIDQDSSFWVLHQGATVGNLLSGIAVVAFKQQS